VRQLFGYDRFEKSEVAALMNALCANEFSLMNNFFCPTMKLAEKKGVGSKIIKKHAPPQTPAQRTSIIPRPMKQLRSGYAAKPRHSIRSSYAVKSRRNYEGFSNSFGNLNSEATNPPSVSFYSEATRA
jgi:hypothetical protein